MFRKSSSVVAHAEPYFIGHGFRLYCNDRFRDTYKGILRILQEIVYNLAQAGGISPHRR